MVVEARATRWVADEPFPGLVEIELVDSHGRTHRFTEKCSVVDDGDRLRPDAAYPIEIALACRIRTDERFPRIDLTPWGIEEDTTTYAVEPSRLSWRKPAAYSDLSIAARQAVALVAFRRWSERAGVRPDGLDRLEEHLWCFSPMTPERFGAWYDEHPLATLDPQYGDDRELSAALAALVQITYGGLFGGLDSLWSLRDLTSVGRFTSAGGVPLPAPDAFVDSLWADHAWGRPSPGLIRRWRRMAENAEDPGQEPA